MLTLIYPPSPVKRVQAEHYINFRGNRLFFDFYVPEINTLFECQGEQHFKMVRFFQADKEAFVGQKKRDNLKLEYIQKENKYLVYINYNDDVTASLILNRIKEAMSSELHCAGLTN